MKKYTHQKRPYLAVCLKFNGKNSHDVIAMLAEGGSYGTAYADNQIMVRHGDSIDTMSIGWWVVRGENGQCKCYDDATFQVKYEAI